MANAADLAGVTIEMGDWTLVPLHDGAATSHIIAARDDDKARDTDIDVVLYIRTAEGWEAEAYEPSTGKENALIALAAEFGLPDPMLGDWGIEDLDPEAVTGFAPPRAAFKTGFFADDPLSDAASGMSDPGPLVEAAESLGLPAAGSAVNTQSLSGAVPTEPQPHPEECGCLLVPCLHNSIAAGIDAMLADPDLPFEAIEAIAHESLSGGGPEFICCPWVWTQWTGPWSAWTCSDWQFSHSVNIPGGGKNCVYARDVRRTQQRTRVKRCLSCRVIAQHQSREEWCTQITTASVPATDPCPNASSIGSPQNCSCSAVNRTGWGPPLPPC